MARDLKPSDLIRTLGGTRPGKSVEPAPVESVYNLGVARGRSFFVGKGGALGHAESRWVQPPEAAEPPLHQRTRVGLGTSLNSTQEKEDQDDQKDGAEQAARRVAPLSAVRPTRDCADQKKDQDHEQNCSHLGRLPGKRFVARK